MTERITPTDFQIKKVEPGQVAGWVGAILVIDFKEYDVAITSHELARLNDAARLSLRRFWGKDQNEVEGSVRVHRCVWSSRDNDELRATFDTCTICHRVRVSEYENEPPIPVEPKETTSGGNP